MLATLQVVIGIVFVMLLFSLLATTVLEFIAGWLSLRGKQLSRSLEALLGPEVKAAFVKHPYFEQLSAGSREKALLGDKKTAFPSYISGSTFSSILLDTLKLNNPEEVPMRLEEIGNENLRRMLRFLFDQSSNYFEFKSKIENWYNEVMDRASGAYKRNSQRWLFGLGLVISLIFNADTLTIYHNLSINSTLREAVAGAAQLYLTRESAPPPTTLSNTNTGAAFQQVSRLVNDNIMAFESPLGLGWANVNPNTVDFSWVVYHALGWLLTALAVSFGASFWFELLKKIMNVRSSGPTPAAPVPAPSMPAPPRSDGGFGFAPVSSGGALTRPEPDSIFERGSIAPRGAKAPKSVKEDDDNEPKG